MISGYARVSGKSQDLAAQLAHHKAARCERIDREKISAETTDQPQLKWRPTVAGDADLVIIPVIDLLSIARSYNVSAATISRLAP